MKEIVVCTCVCDREGRAHMDVQGMSKKWNLSKSPSTQTHTLSIHTMCVMECEIERGLNLAMSLSLRLCLVASFSRSLIISRHFKSRICCTGDIIPAWKRNTHTHTYTRVHKREFCKQNAHPHKFLYAGVVYFENGGS